MLRPMDNGTNRLALLLADIGECNVADIMHEMSELETEAYKDPKLYRDIRHDCLSGSYTLKTVYPTHPLYKYAAKYGDRSIIFGTYCKIVAIVRLNPEEIKRRCLVNSLPPAFDPMMRANIPDPLSYDEIIDRAPVAMDTMRRYFRTYKQEHMGKRRIILLNNGSSMMFQMNGHPVTDTMSNILNYPCKEGLDIKCREISKLTGLLNNLEDDDPFAYLIVEDQYTDYAGVHNMIPDKDGKSREVYSFCSAVQIPSKACHELFSGMAETLQGNYTWNHRKWIRDLISSDSNLNRGRDKEWWMDRIIITTDMSKYSDTLDRAFIMRILERVGFWSELVNEIDHLYSLPVKDKITGRIYTGTMASYQGQYGDFPLITIANLVMQECIYNMLGCEQKEGYNAAVGDDTGFVFDTKDGIDEQICFDTIQYVYNSVGVNINKVKTGSIVEGVGRCDFVKLTFDKDGILPYLEYRSFKNNNEDQVIRDIFDNYTLSLEDKRYYLNHIFGQDMTNYLLSIHKINGGLRTDMITVNDVVMLIDNTWSIMNELNYDDGGHLYHFLEIARKKLNQLFHPYKQRFCGLRDTALCRFRTIKSTDENGNEYTAEQIDDNIAVSTLAINRVGMECDWDFTNLIGFSWDDIQEGGRNKELGIYNEKTAAYMTLSDFMHVEGRFRDKVKGKVSHVYKDHYNNTLIKREDNQYAHRFIPFLDQTTYEVTSIEDFKSGIAEVKQELNKHLLSAYAKNNYAGWCRNIVKVAKYFYFIDNGVKYRLYTTSGKSKYPLITELVMKSYPEYFARFDYDIGRVVAAYQFV